MKIAEALALRADCQKRFEQLRERIARNARVQEGTEPAENPAELLAELERVAGELGSLIRGINRTNASVRLGSGQTLSDALAERDVLRLRRGAYASLALAASVAQERHMRSEIRMLSTVNVAEIQKQADDLARQAREIDIAIQEANWTHELVD